MTCARILGWAPSLRSAPSRKRRRGLLVLPVICVCAPAAAQVATPSDLAARNTRLASEAFRRANEVTHAWLDRADPVTGLLPRRGNDPNWVVRDSAADLYPFMVLCSYFTEPSLYNGMMRYILRQESRLTTRVGRLADDLQPGGAGFVHRDIDLDRIIFGSSEYMKDGLIPITELLGDTPWYYRMRGIAGDIAHHAPYASDRGKLPARTAEVNGNMLQVLSRLSWKTADSDYWRQLIAIADTYFLDILPRTGYLPPDIWDLEAREPGRPIFRLSDHGNEIVGGLSEVLMLTSERAPDKAEQYRRPFLAMIDRLLDVGRNADGVWVTDVELASGKQTDPRPVHCWGYMFNGVYVAYLVSEDVKYKQAVEFAIENVARHPNYLFDDYDAGRGWGANAYSDSIESALVLLNRLPNRRTEAAVDTATRKMFDREQPNGIVEDWYGDGNFIRTALMFAFWKTQGTFADPWSKYLHVGAVRANDHVLLNLSADAPWQGRLRFDSPRHRNIWNIRQNYPRLNEFPEWFTVESDLLYPVAKGDQDARKILGADLISGIPLSLEPGEEMTLKVFDPEPAPYGSREK